MVDAGSTDATANLALKLADRVIQSLRPGRAAQMHEGARAATGELLLFLHADTLLPDRWDQILRDAWTRSAPVASAFSLGFDQDKPFYRFLSHLTALRSYWSRTPHGDQAIALRRETYFKVGGFPEVALMEEYELFGKLKPLGKVLFLKPKVATSTRRYEANGALFNHLRNYLIVILFYLGVPPRTLAKLYK